MKSIKVLSAALALCCVMTFVPELQAQGKSAGKGKAHQNQIDKIGTAVGGLSNSQQDAIGIILNDAETQVAALSPSDRRAKGGEIRKASMANVRKLLTPAQQKKFDALPK